MPEQKLALADQLHVMTAAEIAAAVKSKTLTAREVSEAFIARVDQLNPAIQAVVHLDLDYWRRQADAIDQRATPGDLVGVPVGIKDVFNTEVLPTEMGSSIWRGHKAGNDARCVSYLRRDGALVAAKLDTAEFAVHAPNHVRNPWSPAHVTGTSSGGSAAAVAAAMLPAALGTQTAGSTIRPASWCGVFAMKPSFGLIPRTGVLKTTDTLDNIGIFGRSAADLRLLLDSLRAKGENYPGREQRLIDRTQPASPPKWRIGVVRGPFWDRTADYVRVRIDAFAKQLAGRGDVDIDEVKLPPRAHTAHALHRRIYNPCLSYYFREELESYPAQISPSLMALVDDGRSIPPADYRAAMEEQVALSHELSALFNRFDLLLHHSSSGSAPLGQEPDSHADLNLLWTLAWLPVMNIPGSLSPQGLPFGLQLVGPRYGDYRVISFVEQLVEARIVPRRADVAPVEAVYPQSFR